MHPAHKELGTRFFPLLTLIAIGDSRPDPFDFVDVVDAHRNASIVSNPITLSGVDVPTAISISGGGMYSIDESGMFFDTRGVVTAGSVVRVRLISSASYATTLTTTLTVGGISESFEVTTYADSTPDSLPTSVLSNVAPNTLIVSDARHVSGLGVPAPIFVEPDSDPEAAYSIDGGPFTAAPGMVTNGQLVRLRVRSLALECETSTVHVGIGGASGVEDTSLELQLPCDDAPFPFDNKQSCFIASVAYESADAPEVATLRAFRDRFLTRSELGRAMVRAYYVLSPPIAEYMRQKPRLRAVVRAALSPIVAVTRIALDAAPRERAIGR